MEKALYTLLLLGSGAGVGLASVVGYFHFKLARLDGKVREHYSQGLTKLGIAITQGVLTWRLAELGTAGPASWYSWVYVLGLATTTSGLALQVRDVILALSKAEVKVDGDR